ncbi:fimbrial protein [Burkholderia sp. MSh2]|uniref:Fimbrial protein n=1 Tax=Burkholderia paludis TaxID=1506587 RepID=A0A6P2MD01_9BURK|nr:MULTISPECIES: fimbrial protein [Burkholderia]KEZ06575.1 fimbrial protein [Burkholderia sp. MSh2]KFG95015.1 fimbrial protein [Burkholderia paludis]CAB3754427.1 Major fimbrial subunit SMF-1 [Burkholderia paludis]VWB76716.1 fimbrial protein [Burkholderia paludis]
MQTKLISTLLLVAAATVSSIASAADGTITFNGSVTAQTCTINGNGSGSNNFSVTLLPVSTSALATAGQYAGRQGFSIALTACTPASGNVHTYFEPGPTVDSATGNLIVATGGATNVEIGLLNSDYSRIQLGAPDASQNSKSAAISAAGAATLNYYAQYVATGAATAGAATSSVMYSLIYQ